MAVTLGSRVDYAWSKSMVSSFDLRSIAQNQLYHDCGGGLPMHAGRSVLGVLSNAGSVARLNIDNSLVRLGIALFSRLSLLLDDGLIHGYGQTYKKSGFISPSSIR